MKYLIVDVLLWFWLGDRGVENFFVVVDDFCLVEYIGLF